MTVRTTRFRSPVAVIVVLTVILVSVACAASASGRYLRIESPAAAAASLRGKLLLLSCGPPWTLYAYDPSSKSQPLVVARFGGAVVSGEWYTAVTTCSPGNLNWLLRELFNADFTKMAIDFKGVDGREHVGVLTSSGTLVDLTPRSTGSYITPPDESGAVFRPGSSLMYFTSGTKWMTVDPAKGIGSRRVVRDLRRGLDRQGKTPILFSLDGKHATSSSADYPNCPSGYREACWRTGDENQPYLFSTNGTLAVSITASASIPALVVRTPSTLWTKGPRIPENFCPPTAWLTLNRLFCMEADQSYVLSLHGKTSSSLRPLLPPPNGSRENTSGVVDPSGKWFAFTSLERASSTRQIFKASTRRASTPKKIADIPASVGNLVLVGWY